MVLAAVSLVDDLRGLAAGLRLLLHFTASAAFLYTLGLEWIWILILLVPLVWGVNLYNFMDGLDGLATGMTVVGFGFCALAAALQGNDTIAVLSACVAAAALGFLPFNFAPARAFLGDVGSIPLGFLAGAIGITGWRENAWPLWFPLVVFSPFIVDASVTLARRVVRGARLAEAHREHYYQRLALLGFGHRHTALLEYGLMLLSGAIGVIAATGDTMPQWAPLLALAAIQCASLVAVDRTWMRRLKRDGQTQLQGPQS